MAMKAGGMSPGKKFAKIFHRCEFGGTFVSKCLRMLRGGIGRNLEELRRIRWNGCRACKGASVPLRADKDHALGQRAESFVRVHSSVSV